MEDGIIEKDGLIWNGLRWKGKDEGPDEDESYEKLFLLRDTGDMNVSHPMENDPGN